MAITRAEAFEEQKAERHPYLQTLEGPDNFYGKFPLAVINTCAQERSGRNSKQASITASIESGEMLNAVNVALVSAVLFEDYVRFTNHTWGDDKSLDDFQPLPDDPNTYVLLLAGHTRLNSNRAIARKHRRPETIATILGQVHDVNSVDDILKIQLDENLHEAIPKDREARVLAESFLWEQAGNQQLTIKEFAKRNGITAERMSDALHYVELPPSVRAEVESGLLPFSLGIVFARGLTPITMEAELAVNIMLIEDEQYSNLSEEELTAIRIRETDKIVEMAVWQYVSIYNTNRSIRATKARFEVDDKARRVQLGLVDEDEREDLRLFNPNQPSRLHELETRIAKRLIGLQALRSEQQRALHNDTVEFMNLTPKLRIEKSDEVVVTEVAGSVGLAALTGAAS